MSLSSRTVTIGRLTQDGATTGGRRQLGPPPAAKKAAKAISSKPDSDVLEPAPRPIQLDINKSDVCGNNPPETWQVELPEGARKLLQTDPQNSPHRNDKTKGLSFKTFKSAVA